MKKLLFAALLLINVLVFAQKPKTENVILVTLDGYRWQELFTGAEQKLISQTKLVKDTAALKARYWAATPQERRVKLMPFFWNVIAKNGVIIGNRQQGSRMNLTNLYKFSYPGYNEIFSGHKDIRVSSNEGGDNPNKNIFDFLSSQPQFDKKIVAIANWDAFPKIINTHRNAVPVYVNFKCSQEGAECNGLSFDRWQTGCPPSATCSMVDTITYHFAKEYINRNHPKFAFIGFDETDHFSHAGQYDSYLSTATLLDSYVRDLWDMIQKDPVYKNKTTLIITCDHGRGDAGTTQWQHHGVFTTRAHHVWLAAMGPDTPIKGELGKSKRYYTNQIAATIAKLLGAEYKIGKHTGKAIDLLTENIK